MSHLKTVAKYMRRSPYQSLSAALIMTLTFFTISIFLLLTLFSIRFISFLETSPQLTVFFTQDASVEQILALKKKYEATGKTLSVTYVSKEEALKIYTKQNESTPRLLDLVTADVLPPSLDIQATRPEYLEELARMVKGSKIVEDDGIVYQKDIVDRLIVMMNTLRAIGVVYIGVLIFVSIIVIITILGIKITIRREEIETMRLIGATNWFIRSPFLLEGMLYGIIGVIIGYSASLGLLWYATPSLSSFFKGIPIFPLPTMTLLSLFGVEVLAAVLLGIFASYMTVLRYLK